jgi:hypothetical protein
MGPAERLARNEASRACSTLYRMLIDIEEDVRRLREEIGASAPVDQDAHQVHNKLNMLWTDMDIARCEATRWSLMEKVSHAR